MVRKTTSAARSRRMQPERHILQVIHHHRISRSLRVCSNLRSAGVADAFVTKLNPSGTALDFSTYLGGNASDIAYGIAINAAGNAYVTGQTLSPNFLLVSSIKAPDQNMLDAFVTKLTPKAAKAVYSTLAGGASTEQANGIAVDTAGQRLHHRGDAVEQYRQLDSGRGVEWNARRLLHEVFRLRHLVRSVVGFSRA